MEKKKIRSYVIWLLLYCASLKASMENDGIYSYSQMVAALLKAEGKTDGPVMCEPDGTLLYTFKVEEEFHNQLQRVKMSHPHLIDPALDVADLYGISRSPQRGSLSQTTDQNVPKELRDH
eukprot:11003848-Ditylum_brightwellii.AAC.1